MSKMKRTFDGVVVSDKMTHTVVIKVTARISHPVYKKLIKRDRKFKADIGNFSPKLGDRVRMVETNPISKDKHLKVLEVIKDGSA